MAPFPANIPNDLAKYLEDLEKSIAALQDSIGELRKSAITSVVHDTIVFSNPDTLTQRVKLGFTPRFAVATPDASATIDGDTIVVATEKKRIPVEITWVAYA